MTTENSTDIDNISITEMHHEYSDRAVLVWGAGMDNDGIQRWAAHMEIRTPESTTDWANAFTECQKKIVAMFHEDPLSNNAEAVEHTKEEVQEALGLTPDTEAQEATDATETEKVVEDPVEKEKVIEGARALLTHAHTEVIIKELGITKEKIHGEAQRLHGDSETWTIEIWAKYTEAIAHFHLRKGTLYDNLKPEYTDKKKGPF